MAKRKASHDPLWRFLFLLYCAGMFWLLFCRSAGWVDGYTYREQLRQNVNLTPLYTISNYLYVLKAGNDPYLIRHCFINLAGNVLLFIPTGWLLPRIWKKQQNFFRFFITCTGAVFLVETIQLFTLLGSFDVDDWILNLIGMTIGYVGFHLLGKKMAGRTP